jgi:DNA-binding CsgD family transcriptional regulator
VLFKVTKPSRARASTVIGTKVSSMSASRTSPRRSSSVCGRNPHPQLIDRLAVTGETVRKRAVETDGDLTAREAHIAHLVTEGLTNSEIAAALYLSPRTVDWHLRQIFAKLGDHHPSAAAAVSVRLLTVVTLGAAL